MVAAGLVTWGSVELWVQTSGSCLRLEDSVPDAGEVKESP